MAISKIYQYLFKLQATQKAKGLQPYAAFNTVFNGRIFLKSKIFTIESMITKLWPDVSQLLRI